MLELARWGRRAGRDGRERTSLELPLRVAGYDVDFAGIVNNAVYVRWLEDLRTIWMTRWVPLEECLERGVSPVLARIEVDYRAPLRMGDAVRGQVWVTAVSRASAVMETEIVRSDGKLCTHALQTVAFIDLKTGRPMRLPTEFLEAAS